MEKLKTQTVSLPVSDGTNMNAYIAHPEGKTDLPGILVFQEVFGVNPHIRSITERFASEGFVAIAPELFHRTAPPGWEESYTNFPAVKEHMMAVTEAGLTADMKTSFDWLVNQSIVKPENIFAVGFCMGGTVSFRASYTLQLKGAISFYGGGIHDLRDRAKQIHCPLMTIWGGKDKSIPKEKVEAITTSLAEVDADFSSHFFQKAEHGFFCDARASYNPKAAMQAWSLVKGFIKAQLS